MLSLPQSILKDILRQVSLALQFRALAAPNRQEFGTGFFRLLQRALRVTETQTKHGAKIEKQEREIELLKDSVRTLEAREEFLLARVDAALTQAAAA